MANLFEIERVPYGKDSTPEKDREYRPYGGGPVGTIEDWTEHAKRIQADGLRVVEKKDAKRLLAERVRYVYFNGAG